MYKKIIAGLILVTFVVLMIYGLINVKKVSVEQINIVDDETEWIPVADIDISKENNDIFGYLTIPKFEDYYYVNMPIKNGVELNILATAIGHFKETPFVDGNVCLVAHNSGTNREGKYVGYFDKIKDLQVGDEIVYNYLSKDYKYRVISNNIISEYDLSVLKNTDKNILTLITCIKGEKNRGYRRCVVAGY